MMVSKKEEKIEEKMKLLLRRKEEKMKLLLRRIGSIIFVIGILGFIFVLLYEKEIFLDN